MGLWCLWLFVDQIIQFSGGFQSNASRSQHQAWMCRCCSYHDKLLAWPDVFVADRFLHMYAIATTSIYNKLWTK